MVRFPPMIFTLCLLFALDAVSSHRIVDAQTGGLPSSEEAYYSCSFGNLWTKERHPNYYPVNSTWKGPIFAVHSSAFQLWCEGQNATEAFSDYVEEGDERWLTVTALMAGEDIEDIELMVELDAATVLMQRDFPTPFRVTQRNPLISSVAPMSPSPDWFTGFHDFEPRNTTTDTWYKSFVIKTFPMDAGTLTGNFYTNQYEEYTETFPHEPIRQLDINNIPYRSGVFVNYNRVGDGSYVLPVAKWVCTLENDIPLPQPPAPPEAAQTGPPPEVPQTGPPPEVPQTGPPPEVPQTGPPPPPENQPEVPAQPANAPEEPSAPLQPANAPEEPSAPFQLISTPFP